MVSIKTRHFNDFTDEQKCDLLENAIEDLWDTFCQQTEKDVLDNAEFIDMLKDVKTVHFLLTDFFNRYQIQDSSIPEEFVKNIGIDAIEEFTERFKDENEGEECE